MRCPHCGFVSFPHLAACKRCGKPLPGLPGGRRAPATPPPPAAAPPPAPPPRRPVLPPPAVPPPPAPREEGVDPTAPLTPGAFDFTLPPAPFPPVPGGAAAAAAPAAGPAAAGFWIRWLALLVDAPIQLALTLVASLPVCLGTDLPGILLDAASDPGALAAAADALWTALGAFWALAVLVPLLYEVIFVGWWGRTPGKMLLGLKILRADGGEVDYGRAFLRWIGKVISALPLLLGYVMAAFTPRKRALHDYLAGTRVVRL